MAKTIDIAELGRDADENLIEIEDKSALGLVEFEFMPHWNNRKEYLDFIKQYSSLRNSIVYACKDGDGIIVNGSEIKLVGSVEKIV